MNSLYSSSKDREQKDQLTSFVKQMQMVSLNYFAFNFFFQLVYVIVAYSTNVDKVQKISSMTYSILYFMIIFLHLKFKRYYSEILTMMQIIDPLINMVFSYSEHSICLARLIYNLTNSLTLILINYNRIQSCAMYFGGCIIYIITYFPKQIDSSMYFYLYIIIWIPFLRFLLDKIKIQNQVSQLTNQAYSSIIDGKLIQNYFLEENIAIIRFDKKQNQIYLSKQSMNFKNNLDIQDNKQFRDWTRNVNLKKLHQQDLKQQTNNYAISNVLQLNIKNVNQETLETNIRNLIFNNYEKKKKSKQQNRRKQNKKREKACNQYLGVIFNKTLKNDYKSYSIKIQGGYDYEPYVVLLIKQNKENSILEDLKIQNRCFSLILTKQTIRQVMSNKNGFCFALELYKRIKVPKILTGVSYQLIQLVQSLNQYYYLTTVEKVQLKQLKFNKSEFDVIKIIFNLKKIFSRLIKIKIHNFTNHSNIKIYNYEIKLIQVLVNFIENSMKYNPRKGLSIYIYLKNDLIKFEIHHEDQDLTTFKKLIGCYTSSIQNYANIQIRNRMIFDQFIKKEAKFEWVVNKLLIAQTGPTNQLKVQENKIKFKIYTNNI